MKTILAILAITFLQAYAISQGIDGAALAASCTVIAGLGGYAASRRKDRGRPNQGETSARPPEDPEASN